jgi:hypothetical protein
MAQPHFVFEADWDRDGAYSDFTSDVVQFNMGRGKEEAKEEARAGFMDMVLNNSDHKYTPTKSTSVLFPFVRPGVPFRSFMVYPYDALDDLASGTLDGRAVPNDSNFGSWSDPSESFVGDGAGAVENTDTGLARRATVDFGETDCWVGVKVKRVASGDAGLMLRRVDSTTFVLFTESAGTLTFWLAPGDSSTYGLRTQELDDMHSPPSVGDYYLLSVWMSGPKFHVYVNNELVMPNMSLDFHTPGYDAALLTSTIHGLGTLGTSADNRWSEFGGWKPAFEGRIDHVEPRPGTRTNYVYMKAYDDLERAKKHQVFRLTAPLFDTQDIVAEILDAMGVTHGKGGLDENGQPEEMLGFGVDLTIETEKVMSRDGFTELQQVADDDVGFVYVDGAGSYRYEDSTHREGAPHDAPRATWESEWSNPRSEDDKTFTEPLTWDDGKDLVENEIYYQYYKISVATNQEVWRLPEHLDSVANNPEFTHEDEPTVSWTDVMKFLAVGDGDQLANPRIPEPGTDFTVNSQQDGGGVDLTASQASETGTVSATGSPDFELDDTGQDFTGGPTLDGVSWALRAQTIFIKDASGNRACAFIKLTDPDGDGTRIELLDAPQALSGAAGYLAAETDFDETDTPLTYDVYPFVAWFTDGLDGNFKEINVQGASPWTDGQGNGDGAFLDLLRLMADRGTNSDKVAARAESSISQNANGRRRVQHEALHIDRWETALGRAKARLYQRATARERLGITMIGGSKGNLMEIVHRELSDRVAVNFADMGLDDREYYIDRYQISADLHSGGQPLAAKFGLTGAWLNPGWGEIAWGEFVWS